MFYMKVLFLWKTQIQTRKTFLASVLSESIAVIFEESSCYDGSMSNTPLKVAVKEKKNERAKNQFNNAGF